MGGRIDQVFRTEFYFKGELWQTAWYDHATLCIADPSATGATRIVAAPPSGPVIRAELRMARRERGKSTTSVTCWCERKVVAVPVEEMLAGLTRSCGKPRCAPPVDPSG